MKTIVKLLASTMFIACLATTCTAQEKLVDSDRAVVAFDLQVGNFFADKPEMQERLKRVFPAYPASFLKWSDVLQLEGQLSLPNDLSQINEMKPKKPLPFKGHIQIRLANDKAGKLVTDFIERSGVAETATDGTIVYRPKSENDPPNLLFRKFSETEFEGLTTKFLNNANRDHQTERLSKQWSSTPDKPLRLAIDLVSNAKFFNQVAEELRKSDPTSAVLIDLLAKCESVSLTAYHDEDLHLELNASEGSEEAIAELETALNGLLIVAKPQLKSMFDSGRYQDVIKAAVDMIKVSRSNEQNIAAGDSSRTRR